MAVTKLMLIILGLGVSFQAVASKDGECRSVDHGNITRNSVQMGISVLDAGESKFIIKIPKVCKGETQGVRLIACDFDEAPEVEVKSLNAAVVSRLGSKRHQSKDGTVTVKAFCGSNASGDVQQSVSVKAVSGSRRRRRENTRQAVLERGQQATQEARQAAKDKDRLHAAQDARQAAYDKTQQHASQEARQAAKDKARQHVTEEARQAAKDKAQQHDTQEARQAAEDKAQQHVTQEARQAAKDKARKHATEESRQAAKDKAQQHASEEARQAAKDKARKHATEESRQAAKDKARQHAPQEARQAEQTVDAHEKHQRLAKYKRLRRTLQSHDARQANDVVRRAKVLEVSRNTQLTNDGQAVLDQARLHAIHEADARQAVEAVQRVIAAHARHAALDQAIHDSRQSSNQNQRPVARHNDPMKSGHVQFP